MLKTLVNSDFAAIFDNLRKGRIIREY